MTHWARDVVGRPWAPGAAGPDAFCCWGLVRFAFHVKHGLELPELTVGEPPSDLDRRKLAGIARSTGWRPAGAPVQQDDVILMWSNSRTHVGIVERANGGIGVLHCDHARGVVFEPLDQATRGMRFDVWRRQA